MSLLCYLGIHKWRSERVLEQTLSSGIKCTLDSDVCQRCEALRDPGNVADVYNLMAFGPTNGAPIIMHPKALSPSAASQPQPTEKP